MSKSEQDAREMAAALQQLPPAVQEKVGYIIEGAKLVAGSQRVSAGNEKEGE